MATPKKKKTAKTRRTASSKGAKRLETRPESDAGDRRDLLLKELEALLPELDEEGLEFLLEQARVHRYNMEVERLNAVAERTDKPASGVPTPADAMQLRIVRSKDGSTFNLVAGGKYKIFAPDEMLALARIAHLNADDTEAIPALFGWLKRERGDFLNDLGIARASAPLIAELLRVLRSSFAPPPPR